MKKTATLLIALMLILAMTLTACGTYQTDNTASESAPAADTVTDADSAEGEICKDFTMAANKVVTLNPIQSQSSNDVNVFYLTQIQLVRLYGDELQCDAAESFDVSDDDTVYTFHLRDGLKWSDGVEITAKDFEYAAYCLLDPEFGSPAANSWYSIKNSQKFSEGEITDWSEVGVKALDDKTLEITMEYPLNSFAKTIAVKGLYPLRQDFVESVGTDKLGSSVDTMLYSGPYVITDWVLDSSMDLTKNQYYWDSDNSFPTENIHFVNVDDPNTKVAMFESGEVDAIEQVSSQYIDYLSDYLFKFAGGSHMFLWTNKNGTSDEAGALMSNLNFRQALNYGFNREATIAAVNPLHMPSNRVVDTNFAGTNGGKFVDEYPIDTVPLTGDVDKAKEYLQKAMDELGYADVSELPPITMVTWDATEQKLLCETIIDQWKQNLGLTNVQLQQYVIGTAIGSFYSLDYDIFVITWESDVLPTDVLESIATGGECNYGIWENEEYNSLVKQAVVETDPIKQAQLTSQAEQICMDDAAIVPIYESGYADAVQSYVDGFFMSPVCSGYEFNHLVVHK